MDCGVGRGRGGARAIRRACHSHLRSSRLFVGQARCWPGAFWVLCRQASMAELGARGGGDALCGRGPVRRERRRWSPGLLCAHLPPPRPALLTVWATSSRGLPDAPRPAQTLSPFAFPQQAILPRVVASSSLVTACQQICTNLPAPNLQP